MFASPVQLRKPLQQVQLLCSPSLLSLPTKPLFRHLVSSNSSSSSSSTRTTVDLSDEELTKINLLIPRLCDSNHLPEAVRLVDAALLTNPPLGSLSLSLLIARLASQPDMTHPMSLLNRLKHNPPAHPHLPLVSRMLVSSYLKNRRLREAFKVFNWLSRPDSPCAPDLAIYGLLVGGICRDGQMLEALKVFRSMLAANLVPRSELQTRVYRGLLREARIREAKELRGAFGSAADGGEGVGKVLELLDRLISSWVD
ncbi:pentatricopeptide repeat-containing protein At1g52620-like [Malania oleifera]|uniref:pentatricopeptide repeat-containing protein At1g52620-like n=1 Tax=Malania oleifera TaxID=397392 RepID=UPI0025AE73E5|nr:pentatricopeptide repeat-containing protein At1g52620-like [Malania oleifera]XP_057971504.1 pentatricopeptide repeat-containing protein At1g52620-like [Malania oleifera]XP_057971505.1 pentatricopeptide repeat-containing protein At1g52620-like [Malania oleifera]XP_057971506.1 pentatricopeptide repeat-containing protein At1g52620-like [Malania oleifera]